MPKKPQTDWEKAARSLCRYDGHPENITSQGKPTRNREAVSRETHGSSA
jgi:hypothetical protein